MPTLLDFLFRPPQPGDSNIMYGLRNGAQQIGSAIAKPFQPGGRMDLVHGGAFDPQVSGSIANQGAQIVGRLFGTDKGGEEMAKSVAYAGAAATGPALPPRPFGASGSAANPPGMPTTGASALAGSMFSSGWTQTGKPGDPRDGGSRQHAGWDFAPTGGDPNIRAHMPFQVVSTSTSKLGGNIATVQFEDGSQYKFMHLASLPPRGHKGGAGEVIATAGRTGNATGVTTHVQPVGGAPSPADAFGPATAAAARLAEATGAGAPPGLDLSGYQRAGEIYGQIAADSMRPFGATYERTELAPPPVPDPLQTPDYAAGDAAFAAAAPKNPFGSTPEEEEAGKLRIRRGDYFAGMAKALASINWSAGPGLGELFAKLGAGAVMGAQAGDDEVRQMTKEFDAAMQQYNLALAQRNDGKAREAAHIANQNITQLNNHKLRLWEFGNQQIAADNPSIANGVLRTVHKNEDGTVTETLTPLDPTRKASALSAQAQLAVSQTNAKNEHDWMSFRMNREIFGAMLPYAMAEAQQRGDYATRDGIFAFGLAEASNAVAEAGQWQTLYQRYIPNSAQVIADTEAAAREAAGVQAGMNPNEAQRKMMNAHISAQMIEDFVAAGKPYALIGGMAGDSKGWRGYKPPDTIVTSVIATERERERKTTETRNAKGQVSTTTRY